MGLPKSYLIANAGGILAYKVDDESKISDTTFADDAVLKFTTGFGENWRFKIHALLRPGTGGIKFRLHPTSAVPDGIFYSVRLTSGLVTLIQEVSVAYDVAFNYVPAGFEDLVLDIEGAVDGDNEGVMAFQWAQQVSLATLTMVKQGSALMARKAT